MSQEGQSRRRAKALPLLIIAALLASSCSTKDASDGRVDYRQVPTTQQAPNSNATSGGVVAYDAAARAKEESGAGERYAQIDENPFLEASRAPLSTFSIDVDTASYSNTRRFLNEGQLPPRDAVRIEELVNYFSYDYPQPLGEAPFSVNSGGRGLPLEHAAQARTASAFKGRRSRPRRCRPPTSSSSWTSRARWASRTSSRSSSRGCARSRSSCPRATASPSSPTPVRAGSRLPSTPGDRKDEIIAAVDAHGVRRLYERRRRD